MKTIKMFFVSFFLVCLFPVLLIAQDISVQYLIGKSKSDVIKNMVTPHTRITVIQV